MKVLISMSEEFLSKIDQLAKKEDRSRSELIREAVRFYEEKRYTMKSVNTLNKDEAADAISNMLSE